MATKTETDTEEARSLHGLDGRTGRTYDTQETKWWVVEWRNHRNGWCPAFGPRRFTLEEARERITSQSSAPRDQWRVVEVVERTKNVEEYGDSSPIDEAQVRHGQEGAQ